MSPHPLRSSLAPGHPSSEVTSPDTIPGAGTELCPAWGLELSLGAANQPGGCKSAWALALPLQPLGQTLPCLGTAGALPILLPKLFKRPEELWEKY